jgi:hypothetical protein
MTTQSPASRIRQMVSAALAATLTAVMAQTASAQEPAMARVRSSHPAIAGLIGEGQQRSATFRRLVQAIDASDGIVYIEEGKCHHGVRACLAMSVTPAGPNRLLRVLVDTRKADWDLMGSIGHEMRHAVEVLSDASVRSDSAIYFFYSRVATSRSLAFETDAAVQAGLDVRAEVRSRSASH